MTTVTPKHPDDMLDLLHVSLEKNTFIRLHLHFITVTATQTPHVQSPLALITINPHLHTDPVEKLSCEPLLVKQAYRINCVFHYATHQQSVHLAPADFMQWLRQAFTHSALFKHVVLLTQTLDVHLKQTKKGKLLVQTHVRTASPSVQTTATSAHDHQKHRHIALNAPFLEPLGITRQGELVPAMAKKYKQIHQFIELIDHALQGHTPSDAPFYVADFGSGKGYLTFALHYYLRQKGFNVHTTGIELRPHLVNTCNTICQNLNIPHLQFFEGDVKHYKPQQLDLMIALHACDTATDYAIFTGIRLNAQLIVVAPCCHKEIRPQLGMPQALHAMLTHGIHQTQTAEMLTDSMRAQLMEMHGYQSKVVEFIALEHTNKNKMIIGTRRHTPATAHAQQHYYALKTFYSIQHHTLEQLLTTEADAIAQAH